MTTSYWLATLIIYTLTTIDGVVTMIGLYVALVFLVVYYFKIYCLWVGEGKKLTLNLNVVNINYIGGDVLQKIFKMIFLV